MIKNNILHYLVSEKYNLKESTISVDGSSFLITGNNGELYTEKDFTKSELENAEIFLQNQKLKEIEAKAAEKARLLEKLGITEDEAKLLLA